MAQLMFKIADEQAPGILQYNPNLPQAFVAFFDRAMTKEVAERFQDGEAFAAALRATMGRCSGAALWRGWRRYKSLRIAL